MSIDLLKAVVPPPTQPLETETVERWPIVQSELGIELPPDYLDFARTYGSGDFNDPLWLHVRNPLSDGFVSRIKKMIELLRVNPDRLWGPGGLEFALHPARPGVLPCASGHDGVVLAWYTDGPPSSWPLLLVLDHGRHIQPWQGPLTTFLAQLHSEPFRTLMGPSWEPDETDEPDQERGPPTFTAIR